MQDVIEKEFSRHTVLAVTHQMRFLDWYTHAIVLEGGHVVKQGGMEVLQNES
jgi:ABC-type transport system involved in cytochrome bd biosynthesis fused ATPase/permease subunit